LGYAEEILIDIVKELEPEPKIQTLLYRSRGEPYFCRWNFKTEEKQDYGSDKKPAEGTLLIQGLDPDKPLYKWNDGDYVQTIERKGFPFKKRDAVYGFTHEYTPNSNRYHHFRTDRFLLHHVVLPKYCYYISKSINIKKASILKVNERVCVTWLRDIRQKEEQGHALQFRFSGPNKDKFEKMREKHIREVKSGIRKIKISEGQKQTMLTITALITSALDFARKSMGQ
jgi:hypothetical protein